ncbi:uncharacterized protein LOC144365122 [Ictidomys tridecemlineatus]
MLRAAELTWGRGTRSEGSPPRKAERRVRRGSSSPWRPPSSPLLPDSVPSTKLPVGARLQTPFPPPPSPLPQTEDAPWRLEACPGKEDRSPVLPGGAARRVATEVKIKAAQLSGLRIRAWINQVERAATDAAKVAPAAQDRATPALRRGQECFLPVAAGAAAVRTSRLGSEGQR